jgi:hypothetical protein
MRGCDERVRRARPHCSLLKTRTTETLNPRKTHPGNLETPGGVSSMNRHDVSLSEHDVL